MRGECALCWGHECMCGNEPRCSSMILGHQCFLKAGHDSDHEDAEIWWGDPTPGPKRVEPGNPFSPLVKERK